MTSPDPVETDTRWEREGSVLDKLIDEACGVTADMKCDRCHWLIADGRCLNPRHFQPGDYIAVRRGRAKSVMYVTEGGCNSVVGHFFVVGRGEWSCCPMRWWSGNIYGRISEPAVPFALHLARP